MPTATPQVRSGCHGANIKEYGHEELYILELGSIKIGAELGIALLWIHGQGARISFCRVCFMFYSNNWWDALIGRDFGALILKTKRSASDTWCLTQAMSQIATGEFSDIRRYCVRTKRVAIPKAYCMLMIECAHPWCKIAIVAETVYFPPEKRRFRTPLPQTSLVPFWKKRRVSDMAATDSADMMLGATAFAVESVVDLLKGRE